LEVEGYMEVDKELVEAYKYLNDHMVVEEDNY
jgi:hypothetical protein